MLDVNTDQPYQTQQLPSLDLDERDEQFLLTRFMGLVKRQVALHRFQSTSSFDEQDLNQTAIIALFEAATRFDDIYSDAFPGYAKQRIRGAILDELRRNDSRSRRARQRAHKLEQAERDLTNTLGKKPTDTILAQALEWDQESLDQARQDQLHGEFVQLDEILNEAPTAENSVISGMELQHELAAALEELNEQDRTLLALIYQHELNQKEVAVVLNYTTARVCQIHKAALERLRTALLKLRG